MKRWLTALVLFLGAIGLAGQQTPQAVAQDKLPAPEEESFLTADGVQLKGIFHATAKNPNSAPVVILLYPPGPDRDMTKGDWAGLAKRLNEEGYHVFRFDWRGHGKSTEIKDTTKFWGNQYLNGKDTNYNGYIKGGGPFKKPLKNTINYKELTNASRYVPAYLNDLAAARVHLDAKNDNKTVNTSSIYLIGAEEAATLGMAWLTAEWQRPAVFPNVNQLGLNATAYEFVPQELRGAFPPEGGQDISGAIWLSASRPTSITEITVKKWISEKAPKIRENNPMLFLYGDKDATSKKNGEFFYNDVLVAKPKKGLMLNPLDQTFIQEVKGGNQLKGVKLLGDNATLKTEDTIVKFLEAIQKERAKIPSKARNFTVPYYIDARWYFLTP